MSSTKYTIPKDKRFKDSFKRPICHSIYELPDCKNKKTTGMGYGIKSSIINTKEIQGMPSPNSYRIPTLFENNFLKGKGVSISQKIYYKVYHL